MSGVEETPWVNLIVGFQGVEASIADELIGGLIDLTDSMGATEGVISEQKIEWKLSFPSGVERTEIEAIVQDYLLQGLDEVRGSVGVAWSWESQRDENWAVAYREYFQPVEVPPNYRILAPWHERPEDGRITIVINPGQGFGTGTHETTQLALEALAHWVKPQVRVLDVGSGSGILSIAALKLGAARVVALEMDPAANANARENFDLNAVGDVEIVESDAGNLGEGEFDLIVCNMLLMNSRKLFPPLIDRLKGGGVLILAGFLTRETEDAKSLFATAHGEFVNLAEMGEWARLVWRRKAI